jgi:hypothetical protein
MAAANLTTTPTAEQITDILLTLSGRSVCEIHDQYCLGENQQVPLTLNKLVLIKVSELRCVYRVHELDSVWRVISIGSEYVKLSECASEHGAFEAQCALSPYRPVDSHSKRDLTLGLAGECAFQEIMPRSARNNISIIHLQTHSTWNNVGAFQVGAT